MALSRAARRVGSRTFATQVSALKNGLRVATVKRDGPASAELIVGAGSRHDAVHGSAAVLSRGIATANEAAAVKAGAVMTYGNDRETTTYSCSAGDTATAVGLLSGAASAKLDDKLVAAVKEAHLKALDDEAGFMGPRGGVSEQVLVDRMQVSCFRDCGLGNPLFGTADTVPDISAKTLGDFHASQYAGSNSVLAVVGPADHAQVVAAADKAFGSLPSKATPQVFSKPYFLGAELSYRNDEMGPNAYLALAYEGVPLLSSDSVCFDLFAQLIGEFDKTRLTMPSGVPAQISNNRLVEAVSTKQQTGCANYFRGFNLQYSDTGVFGWFVECDEVAVEHATGELIFAVNQLSSSITPEETERAKRELKLKKLASVETNNGLAAQAAKTMQSYGRHMTAEEYCHRLDAINNEDLKRVAWKYLHDAEVSFAALGPLHGLPDHYHLRRNTAMWRY